MKSNYTAYVPIHKLALKIQKINGDEPTPVYQTDGSAGFDIAVMKEYIIAPQERVILPTGLKVQVPEGYELQVRSRSGLAAKQGLIILNSPGTIDSDYRGEIQLIMFNTTHKEILVKKYDRLAQGVICPIVQVAFVEVESFETTARGEGGLGSTGVATEVELTKRPGWFSQPKDDNNEQDKKESSASENQPGS